MSMAVAAENFRVPILEKCGIIQLKHKSRKEVWICPVPEDITAEAPVAALGEALVVAALTAVSEVALMEAPTAALVAVLMARTVPPEEWVAGGTVRPDLPEGVAAVA